MPNRRKTDALEMTNQNKCLFGLLRLGVNRLIDALESASIRLGLHYNYYYNHHHGAVGVVCYQPCNSFSVFVLTINAITVTMPALAREGSGSPFHWLQTRLSTRGLQCGENE